MIFSYIKLNGLYLTINNESNIDILKLMEENVLAIVIAVCFIIGLLIYSRRQSTTSHVEEDNKPINQTEELIDDETDYVEDFQLVAVITAAIMASMGDEAPSDGLIVRSIKKVNKRKHSNNYSI